MPGITYQASTSVLSTAATYPFFLRMAINDLVNDQATMALLLYMKLYQVGLLFSTDTYSRITAASFQVKGALKGMDIFSCPAFNHNDPSSAANVAAINKCLDYMELEGIKIFVIYITNPEVEALTALLYQRNMYGYYYLYFVSAKIDTGPIIQSCTVSCSRVCYLKMSVDFVELERCFDRNGHVF